MSLLMTYARGGAKAVEPSATGDTIDIVEAIDWRRALDALP
jgi:hypothetical protein